MLTAPVDPDVVAPTSVQIGESTADRSRHSARRFWVLLLLPLAVGGLVRVVCGLADDVPTTDVTAYLRTGESVWAGDGYRRDGEPELHFPPVAPVVLGGAADVFGDPLTGTVVVMIVTGTLLLVPLAAIARLLAGDQAGWAAAWVGALCPALTTVPANQGGGSEGPYILLMLLGLWLALVSARRVGWWRVVGAAGVGALTGLAYLTRPEGILFAAVFLPMLVLAALDGWRAVRARRISPEGVRAAAAVTLAFATGLGVFALPYIDYLHTHTGRWELTAKARDASLEAWRDVAEHDRRARDAVFYQLDDDGVSFVAGRSTLNQLAANDPLGYAGIVGVNLHTAASELTVARMRPFPVSELLPLPLLALAVWAAWRARRQPGVKAVLATGLVALVVPLAFFVQPRYLSPVLAIVCIFVGVGLVRLPERWRRPGWALALLLLAFSLYGGLGGPHHFLSPREQVEHRLAGEWLAQNTPPGTRVMTRSLVVDFYANRVMVPMPYSTMTQLLHFARAHGVDYIVADEYQLDYQRPQFHRLFERGPWPGLRLEHGIISDGRLTRIFALDPPGDPVAGDELPADVGFVGDEGSG